MIHRWFADAGALKRWRRKGKLMLIDVHAKSIECLVKNHRKKKLHTHVTATTAKKVLEKEPRPCSQLWTEFSVAKIF